jgi:putative ABC transport system substrate-binding protein
MHVVEWSRRDFLQRAIRWCGAVPVGYLSSQDARRGVRHIGLLIGDAQSMIDAFKERLRALGYVEGRDLSIDVRIASGPETARHANELAKGDVELMVTAALPFALEIRRANPAMPMVIATCPGMISNGFAKSLEHPGGNVTGMEELVPGVTAKRLTLLKTAAPQVSRVALLSTTPGQGGHEIQLADAERTAASLGITVKAYRAASLPELEAALASIAGDGVNGLMNF